MFKLSDISLHEIKKTLDFLNFISSLPCVLVCSTGVSSTSLVSAKPAVSGSGDSDYYFLDEDSLDAGQPRFTTIIIIIIISVIIIIISVIMIITRFITSESSSNVSVSTGTRANLHCTIENAHRRTVGTRQNIVTLD